MDWKTVGAVAGTVTLPFLAVVVATVVIFNQVNARFDAMQAETNRRLAIMQEETNRRIDTMQTQIDALQADNQRQQTEN